MNATTDRSDSLAQAFGFDALETLVMRLPLAEVARRLSAAEKATVPPPPRA
jgi:hypothetical protein